MIFDQGELTVLIWTKFVFFIKVFDRISHTICHILQLNSRLFISLMI